VLTSFAGATLFGERYGDDEPTVLALHGWQRSHTDFAAMFAEVAGRGMGGVAVDLPGFGATPPPPAPWGSAEYAAALAPLVAELGRPVVVLGHSFGGRIALHLAAAAPAQVRGLVLTGVPQLGEPAAGPRPPAAYRALRALRRARLVGERRLDVARERYGSTDYRAASGVLRPVLVRVLAERYDEQLRAIGVPTELVWGEHDTAAPPASARRAVELLADGRLTVLPGVGHLVPIEAPAALAAALERLG